MAIYSPRLSAPSTTDKNYLHYSAGGYNYCIEIKNDSCLPNCVGYAWGRWREILGYKHKLSTGNAENFYLKADGYARGQKPRVGAVICWRKGKAKYAEDGCGHVAIVEKINNDGTIVCSESNYGGSRFNTRTLKASNSYYLGKNYVFQGFIYLPIEFDKEEPKVEEKPKEEIKLKFEIGDKVIINGPLYRSSTAAKATSSVSNKITTITRIALGAAHPYNTTGDLGWMNEENIKLYEEPKKEKEPIKKGDKVKVLTNLQFNGKPFKVWFKEYDVIEVSGSRVVIGRGRTVTAAVHAENLEKI